MKQCKMRKTYILFFLGVDFLLAILIIFVKNYFKVETANSYEDDFREHKFLAFAIIGLIIPVIEEFLFRYHLVKTKYTYVTLALSSVLFYVFFQKTIDVVVLFVALNVISFYAYFSKGIRRLPIWLIACYGVCFALLHLKSYENFVLQKHTWYFALLFIHYLISSFFISYIRLKEERFVWVLIYHIAYNCMGIVYNEVFN